MTLDDQLDPYLILGVPDFADENQIANAYRRLARRYHPDINQDPRANERMQELNWAYELLSNPKERARFDRASYSPRPDESEIARAVAEAWRTEPRRRSRFTPLWSKVFAHEFRFMRHKGSGTAAGLIIVVAIFVVCSIMSNPSLALMIALPAAWLIALYQPMGASGRSSSVIGAILGMLISTLVCAVFVLRMTEGSEAFAASGQVLILFSIPIATIGGSLVGMMGDGT